MEEAAGHTGFGVAQRNTVVERVAGVHPAVVRTGIEVAAVPAQQTGNSVEGLSG